MAGGLARARGALFAELAPVVGLVFTVLLFLAIPPHANVSLLDVRTVAVHTVIVATAGLGVSLVIVGGGIDLSIGSAVALASVAAAGTAEMIGNTPWMPVAATLAAMATGALCGLYNGVLVTALGLPAFIATLGTLGFFRGVAKWVSGSRPVSAPAGWLEYFVMPVPHWWWTGVAPAVWLLAVVALVTWVVLEFTVFGRRITAIGSNEEAARRCGVPVKATKIKAYTGAGLLIGLAGALQFARLNQGDPTVAAGLELDAIAAVVIGGASLAGGHVSIGGTIVGAIMMAYLKNRCTVMGWPNYVQEIVVGHIIIVAVALDRWRRGTGRT